MELFKCFLYNSKSRESFGSLIINYFNLSNQRIAIILIAIYFNEKINISKKYFATECK
jgi:hypothetical protein